LSGGHPNIAIGGGGRAWFQHLENYRVKATKVKARKVKARKVKAKKVKVKKVRAKKARGEEGEGEEGEGEEGEEVCEVRERTCCADIIVARQHQADDSACEARPRRRHQQCRSHQSLFL
jgi:hypothetical protein